MKNKKINLFLANKSSAYSGVLLFFVFCVPLAITQQSQINNPTPRVLAETTGFLVRGQQSDPVPPIIPKQKAEADLKLISAQSLLVYDQASGTLLLQKNPTTALGIASVTKLLTAIVAYENLNMEEFLTVNQKDILNVSPSLNLKMGDSVKVYDLFNAMLIGSCNDAALMLANHTAEKIGNSFENLMNEKAESLGMSMSHFTNPMGFDNVGNFSTASDLQLLVSETAKYQVFEHIGRQKNYSFTSANGQAYKTFTTNKLIGQDPEISNVKTGFTDQSRGSMITKATHNGHSIVIIILGSKNREQDTAYLKKHIFENFEWEIFRQ